MGKYNDILHLPHYIFSPGRGWPWRSERRSFPPFAALVGCKGTIRETGRLIDQKLELSEDEQAVLDRKQQIILVMLDRGE